MTNPEPVAADAPAAEKSLLPPDGAVRCSNSERERTSAALHTALGDGRLSMDEAEERLGKVYAARYRHELDALTIDLPVPEMRAGWGLVIGMARQQFVDDVAALTVRPAEGGSSRLRRVVLAAAGLAVLLFVIAMIVFVLHGVVGDGPEYWDGSR
jgi:hypothetical protein